MKANKGHYVDGFVFVVPKSKVAVYKKMAELGKKFWLKHGALDYKECVGDDLNIKAQGGMKALNFNKLAKAKKGETVWFSYIVFKSRAHRDAVNKKVMSDPAMNDPEWKDKPMPFEMSRMAYGGFKVVVGA